MPRQTSTIPVVIDALLALFRGFPECAAPVAVFDGAPVDLPDTFVAVGGKVTPSAHGTEEWSDMGGMAGSDRRETYDVEVNISAYVGGGDAAAPTVSAGDAQKAARDAAFAIHHAFASAVVDDPSLGVLPSGWVTVSQVGLEQTAADDEEASKGRRADLTLAVTIHNRLGAF